MSWYVALDCGEFDLYTPDQFDYKFQAEIFKEKLEPFTNMDFRISEKIRNLQMDFVKAEMCVGIRVI